MSITVKGGTISQQEQQAYVDYLQDKYKRVLKDLEITVCGDDVDLKYTFTDVPFERIRRITGYLVGTLDRFNDAKRAEESERIKHTLA